MAPNAWQTGHLRYPSRKRLEDGVGLQIFLKNWRNKGPPVRELQDNSMVMGGCHAETRQTMVLSNQNSGLVETFTKKFQGKGLSAIIAKLALCSGIYNIWKTRNEMVFNEGRLNRLQILKDIESDVQLNLNGWELKDKDTQANLLIASNWDVQFLSD